MIEITFIFTIDEQRPRLYGKYVTESIPPIFAINNNRTIDDWLATKIVNIFAQTQRNIQYPEINTIRVGILGMMTSDRPVIIEQTSIFDMVVHEIPDLHVYLRDNINPFGM